ncbi:MAG TPA: response regulator transcription factor [Bacteroidetes bacterium]|nr:response regulator transcription factor [Bacteroidota bacterium]
MTKILLIDDHQIVLDGMEALLSDLSCAEVIGRATNGQDGLRYILSLQPDLVLLDLDMPIMNGMVVAKEAKEKMPQVKIIILSLHHEASIIQHLIKTGVDGYLLKNADKTEVLKAIETVAGGQKYFSSDVTLALTHQLKPTAPLTKHTDDSAKLSLLSEREIEVLKAIAEGLTNKEIAEQLFISPRTADAHRANIMKKLEVGKVVGLVKFAMRCGLVE